MIVAIDGNIGSGKSSVLAALADAFPVVPEPVDKWSFLSKFYEDQRRYALPLSLEILETFSHVPETAVTERSPLTSRNVFSRMLVNGNVMSEDEWIVYNQYYDVLGWSPDAIVYIDVPSATCFERMRQRRRPCEAGVELEYLEKVERAYKTLLRFDSIPYVSVDGTQPLDEVVADVRRAIEFFGIAKT